MFDIESPPKMYETPTKSLLNTGISIYTNTNAAIVCPIHAFIDSYVEGVVNMPYNSFLLRLFSLRRPEDKTRHEDL